MHERGTALRARRKRDGKPLILPLVLLQLGGPNERSTFLIALCRGSRALAKRNGQRTEYMMM